jgi:hypothetical protein
MLVDGADGYTVFGSNLCVSSTSIIVVAYDLIEFDGSSDSSPRSRITGESISLALLDL